MRARRTFTCEPGPAAPICACGIHGLIGALAPDHGPAKASAQDGSLLSFSDSTPKQTSAFCTADRSATEGLFQPVSGRAVVFRNARVLTMRAREALEAHDVVARDGVIVSVQPSGAPTPADAVVIDATGKTLIPGLADVHGHMTLATPMRSFAPLIENAGDGSAYVLPYDLQLFLLLACGNTGVDIMAGCPDGLWLRDAVRAGKLPGPRLRVGSPLIDGKPPLHSPLFSYIVGDLEGGRRAGEQIAELGFDFAKPYTNCPADGYEGLMQVCERRGIPVVGHVPFTVGVETAIRRGQQGLAHCAELFYNEKGAARSDLQRREKLVRLLADAGAWMQATVTVHHRMERVCFGGAIASLDSTYFNPMLAGLWDEASPFLALMRKAPGERYADAYNLVCTYTNAARQAGVRVLVGTDFSTPHVVEGFALHEELWRLVHDCGFDAYEALRASTRGAAAFHGEDESAGTVSVGAPADLLLLNADPLADIAATREIEAVLAGGFLLRAEKIAEGLARIRDRFAAMPPAKATLGKTVYTS